MSDGTAIEWTDATWNPITGCSVVSPGCTNCYAMRLAGTRLRNHATRVGLTRETKAGPVWTGDVRFNDRALTEPLRWTKPRMIFVCAHGDLFHENVPDEWIDRVFAVMALCPQHTFQVLTKRSARMRAYLTDQDLNNRISAALGNLLDGEWIWKEGKRFRPIIDRMISAFLGQDTDDEGDIVYYDDPMPLPNVWLGVSAEDQTRYDERKDDLRATPAAVRWWSMEPLLGRIVTDYLADWIVVGGESGPRARPMHPQWARDIRDQCDAAGVPFFFKQWGEWAPAPWKLIREPAESDDDYKARSEAEAATHAVALWGQLNALSHAPWSIERVLPAPKEQQGIRLAGKKAAGRLLDGREHNGMPRSA